MPKYNPRYIEDQIFYYVNQTRIKHGLNPVKKHKCLTRLAKRHSNNMARANRIYHGNNCELALDCIKPGKKQNMVYHYSILNFFFDGASDYEQRGVGGFENCAYMPTGIVKGFKYPVKTNRDIAKALHITWMRSKEGHRENVLDPDHFLLGVGVWKRGNRFYATELFFH
jgi:uncharacterized protein YkwD